MLGAVLGDIARLDNGRLVFDRESSITTSLLAAASGALVGADKADLRKRYAKYVVAAGVIYKDEKWGQPFQEWLGEVRKGVYSDKRIRIDFAKFEDKVFLAPCIVAAYAAEGRDEAAEISKAMVQVTSNTEEYMKMAMGVALSIYDLMKGDEPKETSYEFLSSALEIVEKSTSIEDAIKKSIENKESRFITALTGCIAEAKLKYRDKEDMWKRAKKVKIALMNENKDDFSTDFKQKNIFKAFSYYSLVQELIDES